MSLAHPFFLRQHPMQTLPAFRLPSPIRRIALASLSKAHRFRLGLMLWLAPIALVSLSWGQSPQPTLAQRLMPQSIWVGPEAGVSRTHITTTAELSAILMPIPGTDPVSIDPIFGISARAVWLGHLSLSVAMHKEAMEISTPEGMVSFPNNPFPHTLSSRTSLSYNVYPVTIGFSMGTPRHAFSLHAGYYWAFLDQADVQWTVDGDPYPTTRPAHFRSREEGYSLATEFTSQWGNGQWVVSLASRRNAHSLTEYWRGNMNIESGHVLVGYRWNLFALRKTNPPAHS